MIKYNAKDGVWRTIGGRRVFIKNGQSLSDAMKESGKFGKKKKVEDEEYKLYKQAKERPDTIDPMTENSTDWETLDKKYSQRYTSERPMTEEEYTAKIREIQSRPYYKQKMNEAVKELDKKYGDKSNKDKEFDRLVEASDKIDHENRKKALTDKYLPKETEIKTQGKSNRKEVSENIQAHILEHYDNPVDFIEQMDAMDYLPTRWQAGQKLAEGGSYLIYNGDMAEFLDSLKINPKGKTFSDVDAFSMYTSLIGRESSNLYDRLQKMFNDYRSQHGGSDLTLDDFRKWFE